MSATYDLFTPAGKVRMRIPDTNIVKPVFTDDEIDELLSQYSDLPENKAILLTAADALEILAGDPQRASSWSRGGVSVAVDSASIWRKINRYRTMAMGGLVSGTIERSDFW